jgi:transmembrane sensor
MDPHAPSNFNTQIYEEACAWFVECRSGDLDAAARAEFDRWLRKSPEHLSAYVEIAAIWNEGSSLDPTHKWDIDTLISQAARDADNVIALPGMSLGCASQGGAIHDSSPHLPSHPLVGNEEVHAEQSQERVRQSHAYGGRWTNKWRLFAIAASAAVLGSIAVTLVWHQLGVLTYVTAIGEQRSIALADGSTVELNSRSKIKVRYSEHERAVELLEGQALFHVAKNHARPFVVSADGTRVRAVGTQFDVYRKHTGTLVTVVEGQVAILTTPAAPEPGTPFSTGAAPSSKEADGAGALHSSPLGQRGGSAAKPTRDDAGISSSGGGTIYLSAGEQLTVSAKSSQKTDHPNIAGATAWRQRQIVFESASLSDVAEEFNRYNERQLSIEDPDLYDFHISGVFSSTDPDSLIRFLRERPDVHVTETSSEIRITKYTDKRG